MPEDITAFPGDDLMHEFGPATSKRLPFRFRSHLVQNWDSGIDPLTSVIHLPTGDKELAQPESGGHPIAYPATTMDTRDMNICMELRSRGTTDGKTSPRHLNAILLCENSPIAFQNAPQLLTRFGEHLDIHPRTWTFDALSIPTSRAAALQTAREAGVILVSAQADADLPSSVRSFLKQAVATRPELPKPIALLAAAAPDTPAAASNVSRDLRRLATSAGTEFFVLAARDSSSSPDSPARSVPSELAPTSQRHWGINE
jgi:hypothetical protein